MAAYSISISIDKPRASQSKLLVKCAKSSNISAECRPRSQLIIKIITIIIKIKNEKEQTWELKTKSAGRRQNMARHVQPARGVRFKGGRVAAERGLVTWIASQMLTGHPKSKQKTAGKTKTTVMRHCCCSACNCCCWRCKWQLQLMLLLPKKMEN